MCIVYLRKEKKMKNKRATQAKPRTFGLVTVKFLLDAKSKKLSDGAVVLAMHMMAGKHSHTIGVTQAPYGYMACDMGISEEEIISRAEELHESGLVIADIENSLLALNFNEYRETYKFPNTALSVYSKFEEMPDCFVKFRIAELILEHESTYLLSNELVENISKYNELHSDLYNAGSVLTKCTSNKHLMLTTSKQVNKITNKQINNKQINNKTYVPFSEKTENEKPKKQKIDKLAGFDDFWKRYPRAEKKQKAKEAWSKNGCYKLIDEINEDLDERERLNPWRPNYNDPSTGVGWDKRYPYIPHPTSYINAKRWEDENKLIARDAEKLSYSQRQSLESEKRRAEQAEATRKLEEEKLALLEAMTDEERAEYDLEQRIFQQLMDEE